MQAFFMKHRQFVLITFAIILIQLAALPIITYPLGPDQGTFAVIGQDILEGGTPYVDSWDVKPPLIYYAYALSMAVFGETSTALRLIDIILIVPIALCLYWIGRRATNERVGLWAMLIFATMYFRSSFWTLTQNDGIAILPMALAVIFTIKANDVVPGSRQSMGYAFGAGIFAAITLWFKYPFIAFVLALAFYRLWRLRGNNYSSIIKEGLSFTAGGVLLSLVFLGYLALIGGLDEFLRNVEATSSYASLNHDAGTAASTILDAARSQLRNWYWMIWLIPLWPFLVMREKGFNATWGIILFWLAGALLSMLVQARGYEYHWLPMLPSLALIAADSLDRILVFTTERIFNRQDKLAYIAISMVGVIGLLGLIAVATWEDTYSYILGNQSRTEYYQQFRFGDSFLASESQEVSDYISDRVSDDNHLYIWGFRPEVYFMSDLDSPTRFFNNHPLAATWSRTEWQNEAMLDIQSAQPFYVLVLENDSLSDVTGYEEDSHRLLRRFAEFETWLDENYIHETQIGNFQVWRLEAQLASAR
jgi:4-amino-4-deoxy-L-arabinose transferase-like glycosyltransferase